MRWTRARREAARAKASRTGSAAVLATGGQGGDDEGAQGADGGGFGVEVRVDGGAALFGGAAGRGGVDDVVQQGLEAVGVGRQEAPGGDLLGVTAGIGDSAGHSGHPPWYIVPLSYTI